MSDSEDIDLLPGVEWRSIVDGDAATRVACFRSKQVRDGHAVLVPLIAVRQLLKQHDLEVSRITAAYFHRCVLPVWTSSRRNVDEDQRAPLKHANENFRLVLFDHLATVWIERVINDRYAPQGKRTAIRAEQAPGAKKRRVMVAQRRDLSCGEIRLSPGVEWRCLAGDNDDDAKTRVPCFSSTNVDGLLVPLAIVRRVLVANGIVAHRINPALIARRRIPTWKCSYAHSLATHYHTLASLGANFNVARFSDMVKLWRERVIELEAPPDHRSECVLPS